MQRHIGGWFEKEIVLGGVDDSLVDFDDIDLGVGIKFSHNARDRPAAQPDEEDALGRFFHQSGDHERGLGVSEFQFEGILDVNGALAAPHAVEGQIAVSIDLGHADVMVQRIAFVKDFFSLRPPQKGKGGERKQQKRAEQSSFHKTLPNRFVRRFHAFHFVERSEEKVPHDHT